SNSGLVGPIFSASSGFSTDLHISSIRGSEKHPRQSPFISQSKSEGASSSLLSHSAADNEVVLHSSGPNQFGEGNNDDSWSSDFLDFQLNTAVETNQLDGSNMISSEDLGVPNVWHDWADQLITDDDPLAADWNELLTDTTGADPEPKL
ncbi:hypothetical protein M569_06217, partial [Genlisea aurea]